MHDVVSVLAVPVVERGESDFCEVARHPRTGQNALFATRSFDHDQVITSFSSARTQRTATYLTIQIGDDLHIELLPGILQYMNHSCNPNCFFDTSTMQVLSLRPVQVRDELTFFYPSTEWAMAQPFECLCGSENCLHYISGASDLAEDVIRAYRLSTYIQSKRFTLIGS